MKLRRKLIINMPKTIIGHKIIIINLIYNKLEQLYSYEQLFFNKILR